MCVAAGMQSDDPCRPLPAAAGDGDESVPSAPRPPDQKRLAVQELASASRSLSPTQPEENHVMVDHDDAPDLMQWMIALQQDKWRQAMPGIRKQMAALERETLDASMTLPETLHVQAEMMMLRQVIAGMEAAH
jgi:hypothetical protein